MSVRGDALANCSFLDKTQEESFRRRLLSWYRDNARDLPWRSDRDAYCIWVSEIMLQQTQVATVVSYYQRFLERFPAVHSLAEADEQEVLRLWEGLGYYRRARQLHAAARVIVDEHDGRFPRDAAAVRSLPGIGRYTAGAILSIAFGQREPILEANTIRVLSRLVGYGEDTTSGKAQRLLWDVAERVLPQADSGTFNQALMELGSQLCVPGEPRCLLCPVREHCHANRLGLQHQIPAKAQRTKYQDVTEAAILVSRRQRVLVRRCVPGERWAGLWDFPRFPVAAKRESRLRTELANQLADQTGLDVQVGDRIKTIKHGVTRFRITLHCYPTTNVSGRLKRNGQQLRWVSPEELAQLPLSVTGRKLSGLVRDNL